jgi:hypothetical protein
MRMSSKETVESLRLSIAALLLLVVGVGGLYVSARVSGAMSAWLLSTSATLITAVTITLIYNRVLDVRLLGRLDEAVGAAITSRDSILSSGIVESRNRMPWVQIQEAASSTEGRFIMLQTWSPHVRNLLLGMEDLIRKGKSVKLYLLHPDSPSARARSEDLGDVDLNTVKGRIETNIREIHSFYVRASRNGATKINVEMWLYDCMPEICVYANGATAWIGWYWLGRQADDGTNLLIQCDSRFSLWSCVEAHIRGIAEHPFTVQVDLSKGIYPSLKRSAAGLQR